MSPLASLFPAEGRWNFTTTQFACDDREYERSALDVEEKR